MTLLNVQNLTVEYQTKEAAVQAVNDVSFTIDKNERFGLVGESGCGKTTIAKSILRILPDNGHITGGSIDFAGTNVDLATATDQELQRTRWEYISMIAQSAMNALDPVYTIEEQIIEAILLHEDISRQEASERIDNLLERVGLDARRKTAYPHQLSGGMRQRAMIAMALALDPALIIADEPTTALDVITQDHILEEINDLMEALQSSLLIITHDISVVAETCDRVGVMYGGKLVEVGPVEEVFTDPEHPYTLGLLNAFPTIEGDEENLITMPGEPPDLRDPPTGCSFYDRCPYREAHCKESHPPLTSRGDDWQAACYVSEERDLEDQYDNIVQEEKIWKKL